MNNISATQQKSNDNNSKATDTPKPVNKIKKAFIFPGQGSQKVGMGKDFYDNFSIAKQTFEEVDESLNFHLSKIIFQGPADQLTLTKNTQPALMATSIAILRVIIDQSGKKINELCNFVAGHSLGEYSALCAAGVISLADTAKLLQLRGQSMQQACPEGEGAMAACIGIEDTELIEIIQNSCGLDTCQIANDNVEGQIVISGKNASIDQVIAILKNKNFKAIKLNVSAPFHSNLIKDAVEPMQQALAATQFNTPEIPIITNVTADIENQPERLKLNLINQICHTVRWRETMHKFNELQVHNLVEVGSGKVLCGLAKKSPIDFTSINIEVIEDLLLI